MRTIGTRSLIAALGLGLAIVPFRPAQPTSAADLVYDGCVVEFDVSRYEALFKMGDESLVEVDLTKISSKDREKPYDPGQCWSIEGDDITGDKNHIRLYPQAGVVMLATDVGDLSGTGIESHEGKKDK